MTAKIFVVLLVLSVVALSECLRCYKCYDYVNSDCAKAVVSAMEIETCAEGVKFCHNDDITGARTGRSVSRSCQQEYSTCDSYKGVQDIGVTACEDCTEDLCNVGVIARTL